MPQPLLLAAALWLAAMNLTALLLMGADKARARNHRRRIPEKMLFLPAVLGGAAGGWAGMYLFHHKTRHWYFRYGFPLLALLDLALLVWLAPLWSRL